MTVGGNTFYRKRTSIHFKVQNITHLLPSEDQKKYYVFNAVIYPGQVLDLLAISGISEADIRESLIKGELANRIRNKDLIIVSSSIDLLQFDEEQREFLAAAGVKMAIDPKKIAVDAGTPYLELGPLGDSVPPNSLFFDIDGTPSYTDENGDPHPLSSGGGGGGAPTNASYVTLNTDMGLSNERVLTQGAGISITDNGPGSSVVIANTYSYTPTDASVVSKGVVQLAGDLGGTAASPSVLKVNGVAVSGTPATGYAPIATSATTATWQAIPAAGAPTNAVYLTLAPHAGLSDERVLNAGTNISFVDDGPGSAFTINSTYTYTPTDATTGAKGIVQLAGDLGGTSALPSVLRVNGISVSGTPTVGQSLIASSTSAAGWAALNLGTAAAITGVLPRGNQQAQNMLGDVTGTTAASVVSKVNGITVTGTPTSGQVLTASSSTAASWQDASGSGSVADATTSSKGIVQLAGDIAGVADSLTVVGLRGRAISSNTPQTDQVLKWNGFSWEPADESGGGGGGAPTDAQYLTLATNGTLSNERVLTAGTNIQFVDGGAGSTLTINSFGSPNATNGSPGLMQIAGDLSGLYDSPIVRKINGIDLPASQSLTVGNTLQAVSATTLDYGPINLAGGINYVTGTLPGDNVQNASSGNKGVIFLAGDLSGFATTPTVSRINGATVPPSGALVTGNVLQVTNVGALSYAPINLAGGANYITGVLPAANMTASSASVTGAIRLTTDLAGSATAPTVTAITGASNVATVRAPTVNYTGVANTTVTDRWFTVTTSNATPTAIATIAAVASRTNHFEVLIIGRNGTTQQARYKRALTVLNNAGTLVQLGSVDNIDSLEDDAAWDATITTSGANVIVQVTGKAATTIVWVAKVSIIGV